MSIQAEMIGSFGVGLAVLRRLAGIGGSCIAPTDHEHHDRCHKQRTNDQYRQKLVESAKRAMRKHYHMNHGFAPCD
jgi:hypothetical protein